MRKASGTDAAFEAFRRTNRAETRRVRRAAIDQLLQLAASAPNHFGARDWADAAKFLRRLHAQAWLNETRVVPPDRIVPEPQVTRRRIGRFHAELCRGLQQLFPMEGSPVWERRYWKLRATAYPMAVPRQHGRVWRTSVATWPDTIWVTTLGLLEEFGSGIFRCAMCPERRLFVKSKRQVYCSRRCSQRKRSARWYQHHRVIARERRRQVYVRRVLGGRKGVVARRPRKTDVKESLAK